MLLFTLRVTDTAGSRARAVRRGFRILAAAVPMVAAAHPAAARADVVTAGSTLIVDSGGVTILANAQTQLLVSGPGITFSLSANPDGSVALSMPGFVAASGDRSEPTVLLKERDEQVLTGTTPAYETLSVSRTVYRSPPEATLVLAQYN